MDAIRVGSDVRLLRRRRGWSQRRLAAEARVSGWAVGTLESGRAGRLRLDVAIAVVAALGGYLSLRVPYDGAGLDRLRDRRHAELVEHVVGLLRDLGWEVATEVSFNISGERGSIDILAFHRATQTLLVIEVKTVVPDLGVDVPVNGSWHRPTTGRRPRWIGPSRRDTHVALKHSRRPAPTSR